MQKDIVMNRILFNKEKIILKYLVGEFKIFSFSFSFFVYNKHFSEVSQELEHIDISKYIKTDIDGVLFQSYPIKEKYPELSFTRQYLCYRPKQYKRFFIDPDRSFEDYLSKFSSKSRNTLKRKVRKYDNFCKQVDNWKEYRTVTEMEEFYSKARVVSRKTYQERLLNTGLPIDQSFKDAMFTFAREDSVRGYLLFHGTNPVAYLYCPVILKRIFLYNYLGYDLDYQKWSVGTVLQYKVLKHLFTTEHDFIFDFTEGEGPHKSFFANRSALCADIYYFKWSFRNVLLIFLHISMAKLSNAAVKMLEIMGIKSMIKKIIRNNWK